MKKSTLLVAALAFGVTGAFAQDLTSKKGETFLPEAGDWSIGIEATPFLNYIGNMFSANPAQNTAPTWNFLNVNNTIIGKMYSTETMAYRGILRIGMHSNHQIALVAQDGATAPTFPAAPATVEDEMKTSSHAIGLGAGLEWRRGKTRLQGFYGADFMFWMAGSKSSYTYGNPYSTTNTAPTTTDFGTNIAPTYATWGGRVIEEKAGSSIGFGVRGFIGAEYFIIPKLSIGGEFGWGVGINMMGESTAEVESGGPTAGSGQNTDYVTEGKSGGFMIDTDQNMFGTGSASLRLNLHF